MCILGEQINRILTLRSKLNISGATLKSLQTRFKVTEKSLKQQQPSNENISLMLTGFSEIVNPRRSPPHYSVCYASINDYLNLTGF